MNKKVKKNKRVKKNKHRKTDPYIPLFILLLGGAVVVVGMSLIGEKQYLVGQLSKIFQWERQETEVVSVLPKKTKEEVHLEVPLNVKVVQPSKDDKKLKDGEVKITWDGCEEAMAYDICIDDGKNTTYEEVYTTEFVHSNMEIDKLYTYKVRARRYGIYTYWTPNVFYKNEVKQLTNH